MLCTSCFSCLYFVLKGVTIVPVLVHNQITKVTVNESEELGNGHSMKGAGILAKSWFLSFTYLARLKSDH